MCVQVCTGTGVSQGAAGTLSGGDRPHSRRCSGFARPVVTGPPEGGQRGGCPEWGPWRQPRPPKPALTCLLGGLSRDGHRPHRPWLSKGHHSDVKLLPSSSCFF